MAYIKKNKKLGNYTVRNNGKSYTHTKRSTAVQQVNAIKRVKAKRASRMKK